MILRVPEKSIKKVGIKPQKNLPLSENPYIDWSIYVYRSNRVEYITFFNTSSFLSCSMYGKGINENNIINEFLTCLKDYLKSINQELVFQKHIVPFTHSISISKSYNKQVIGAINNLIMIAKSSLDEVSPYEINDHLNEVPINHRDFNPPLEIWRSMK